MPINEKNKRFEVRCSLVINGKQIHRKKRNIKTKGEARCIEVKLIKELEAMKVKFETSVTWEVAVEQYLNDLESRSAASTFYTTKTTLQAHTGEWNSMSIIDIREKEIRQLIESRLSNGCVGTKANLCKFIRGTFRIAIERGQVDLNPAKGVSYKKDKMDKLQAMSKSEIFRLLVFTKETDNPWYLIYYVKYELGLRSGEALALTWVQICFETNSVRIDRAWDSKSKSVGLPKSRKARTIKMNQKLATFLKELKLKNPLSENVLPQLDEWKQGKAARALRSIQKEIGIRETNFHSLRASFITHLLLAGVAITKVQAMVGHKDLKTTERYVRLCGSDLEGATDAIAIDFDQLDSRGQVIPIGVNASAG